MMKKLVIAAALAAATTAFAEDQTKSNQKSTEATDVGSQIKKNSKEWARQAGLETEDKGTFKSEKAFDISGTVKGKPHGSLDLARAGLPDAKLDLRDKTQIMLDGKKVEAKALPEGAKVKAKFQLEGGEAVAVRVEATSQQGVGGSGVNNDVKDDTHEGKEKLENAGDKAEDKADHAEDKLDSNDNK